MIKAIIFDLDGTLYDYENCNKKALEVLYQRASNLLKIPPEIFKEAYNIGRKRTKLLLSDCASVHSRFLYCQHALEYLHVNPIEHSIELEECYWSTFINSMRLFDGVFDLFENLHKNNIKIAICTDLTAKIQYSKIVHLGIEKYIDCIVTSEEVGIEKPDYKIFNLVLKKLNVNPNEVIMVGDDFKKDILGAEGCNIRGFLFTNDSHSNIENNIKTLNNYTDGKLLEYAK